MLAGLTVESAPPLRGYTRTRARKEAEVLLSTNQGDPLLARWQVGLGQVAAWTSDLGARWSGDLARWPTYGKLWAQIARGTMRRGAAHQFPLHAQLTGDEVEVRVDTAGADDQQLTGLGGRLEFVEVSAGAAATHTPVSVPLAEVAPGSYEATVPVRGPGALLLTAHLSRAGQPIAEARGRLSLPLARELMPAAEAGAGRALLESLARRTGGGPTATVEAVLDAGRDSVRTQRSLRVPLLIAAILVFLADVALRRVRLRRS
jgi:hypothetical protein